MTKDKKHNNQEIIQAEAKPIEEKKSAPERVDNIRIDKLTLNFFAQPLKKRYEKHYKEDKIHLIIDLVLLAIILILLGVILNIYFFASTKKNNLVDFQVSSNPVELINGQETEFTINYTNTTNDTLSEVSLVLKQPETLHKPEYSIETFNLQTNTLKIGELAPQAHGQFKLKGFLLGDLETKQEFLAVINYKNKYGQDRQEFFRCDFELNGSALHAEMTLPEKAIATSPFTSQIEVKNTSDINFDDLKISLAWPDNVHYISSNLSEPNDKTWIIGNYQAGQEEIYEFSAKAYINQPQTINLRADFYANYDGQEFLLAKAEKDIWIDFSKVKIGFINLENTNSITPGGSANYTISYKNEENYTVTNLELGLIATGEYATGQTVKINRNDYQKLAKLEPGQEASIDLPLGIKSVIDFSKEKETYNIEVKAIVSFDDPNEKARITVESKPTVTKVSSRLSLNTAGVFYTPQGDQIGVGSVPPVVGQYTSYWAFLKIVNTNNDIKDVKLTATIPAGVEFTDIYNVTAGNQIVFEENSRTITWVIGDVERFAGIFKLAPEARIQLAIVPSENQVGTSPLLLNNISVTATDKETGTFLSASGANISTDIFLDEILNQVIQ